MAVDGAPLLSSHGESDGNEVEKPVSLVKEFGYESKRLWHIAGPAIFTSICQYSLGALTQTFAGQVSELDLAAVSVENSVIAGLAFGVMAEDVGGLYAKIMGRLPNPLIPVDAISICMNINGWDAMIAIGFNAAISVRVSNELGAGNAWRAKFSVLVVSITSVAIGLVCMILVFSTKDYFPYLFTNSAAVAEETTKLSILLGFTVLLNSLQPVLSGVAVGAGWQALVAYINIGCYYVVGLPAGILLGFTFGFGVMGIWSGMIGGIVLQTLILVAITALTNWNKEADEAESRVKRWGGSAGEH
ncbi:Multi antimicrobial extrusion protein [Corchorus olitorius]|uniref:Multi antimicrobial extrusion protein n=1 Tax=Corchorus olitorius TaxID=93759 RepID=A0A1R3HXA3_9ROSI|nr:Multi antimicrobial extrusion protein [Corchorus olitorius]